MALMKTLRRLAGIKEPVADVVITVPVLEIDHAAEERREINAQYERISNWDGKSISDLPMALIRHDPDNAREPALARTVPEKYRGSVSGAISRDGWTGAVENSEWSTSEAAEILAIDKNGQTLICRTSYNDYLGSEGFNIRIMPQKNAFAMIDDLRAETVTSPLKEAIVDNVKSSITENTQKPAIDQATKTEPSRVNRVAHAAMAAGMLGR